MLSIPQVRLIQRRAYGCRDEEHMRLKILTTFLPKKWEGFIHANLR
ncbi:MAG: hypothetical protein JSS39_06700 [Nitrospira sp.]|nr:hypothetical protein [Nitrospira sp.]